MSILTLPSITHTEMLQQLQSIKQYTLELLTPRHMNQHKPCCKTIMQNMCKSQRFSTARLTI